MPNDETPTQPNPVEPTPEPSPTNPDAPGDDEVTPSATPICTPAQDANGTCPK